MKILYYSIGDFVESTKCTFANTDEIKSKWEASSKSTANITLHQQGIDNLNWGCVGVKGC